MDWFKIWHYFIFIGLLVTHFTDFGDPSLGRMLHGSFMGACLGDFLSRRKD